MGLRQPQQGGKGGQSGRCDNISCTPRRKMAVELVWLSVAMYRDVLSEIFLTILAFLLVAVNNASSRFLKMCAAPTMIATLPWKWQKSPLKTGGKKGTVAL